MSALLALVPSGDLYNDEEVAQVVEAGDTRAMVIPRAGL